METTKRKRQPNAPRDHPLLDPRPGHGPLNPHRPPKQAKDRSLTGRRRRRTRTRARENEGTLTSRPKRTSSSPLLPSRPLGRPTSRTRSRASIVSTSAYRITGRRCSISRPASSSVGESYVMYASGPSDLSLPVILSIARFLFSKLREKSVAAVCANAALLDTSRGERAVARQPASRQRRACACPHVL